MTELKVKCNKNAMYGNAIRLSGAFSNVSAQCTYEFDDEGNNNCNKVSDSLTSQF